jgi:S1-C subfamily serine protease
MRFTGRISAVLAAAAVVAMTPATSAEPLEAVYQNLLSTKAPVVVNVKFVLKLKGSWGERERESEITGVMIDAKGIVLCSNMSVGGFATYLQGRVGEVSVTPSDIKVLIDGDSEGVEAELIARDTELDLAWIRIKQPDEKGYAYQDLAKAATPKLGDPLFCVRRMGKYFDRTAAIVSGQLAGITKKPRDLYVPAGEIAGALGLPVYTIAGEVVGVLVVQLPDPDEMEMDPQSVFQEMESGLILPAANVVAATTRALENAAKNDAAKAEKKDKPDDADDPDDGDKDGDDE